MTIAFIGVGNVGAPLADHLQRLGHRVTIAARDPQSKSVQAALECGILTWRSRNHYGR
jgi:3-hydroxyisobutyrate dehydrogenase-like beta-hydroxyacid dehydrogenase